jgi:hypothetical protein
MTTNIISKELHDEHSAALEELEIAKRRALSTPNAVNGFTTPAELSASNEAGDALDKASEKCSEIANRIAAL